MRKNTERESHRIDQHLTEYVKDFTYHWTLFLYGSGILMNQANTA